ncbi:hypothetical protein B566_EDAN014849 [Ephemera danica]|nr:hypothetical protein B566_EDAN014849 [Ephemera danica]
MADAFNMYFKDTTEELIEGALPEKDDFNIADLLKANQNSNFEFTEISSDDVLKIIKSLTNRFIAGPDEIPNSIKEPYYLPPSSIPAVPKALSMSSYYIVCVASELPIKLELLINL